MSTSVTVPSQAACISSRKDTSILATATRAGSPGSITARVASGSNPAARNAAG